MSLTAVVSSTADGASGVTTRLAPVGLGVGGIFVAVALVLVLVYANLIDASEIENDDVRQLLRVTLLPLVVTFAIVILYQSLAVI